MFELKINSREDRNHVVTALANNGYTVKIVQRKRNEYLFSQDYFIQIIDGPLDLS